LLAYALALLDRASPPPSETAIVAAMERAQDERTPDFLEGLDAPRFLERFMASRLGSTTHISVLDADGWACSVTCTNGEGSGVLVPAPAYTSTT
jgi:gamma-glutamyltranspeptidase/glutathione hydrolase